MAVLKFIALSGTTEVTENLYIYEYGNDIMVIDCGFGFPGPEMYGVDVVIPDFTYLIQNKHKIKGVVVTHGHEDHLGALPFLLKEIKVPIYATKLVAGFIEDKFKDYGVKSYELNVFDPDKDKLSVGVFKVTPFRVSHSVPDGSGFAIETPEGVAFHVADYKFDWTPVTGEPFDVAKAAKLADREVLFMASDCLGSTTPGYTESEAKIQARIEQIVKNQKGKVFFTTISSNVSRVQQALNVAQELGRKVAIVGRSIEKKSEIARRMGYLKYPNNLVVPSKEIGKYSKEKIMYIIAGSYGQVGSSLYRVALGEHRQITAEAGDLVIFSSDPAPPGTKQSVDFIVDKLFELGADVNYYDIQEDLHVSGHGSQEDIKMLFAIVKPKYYIPIGGTIRHMKNYSLLAQGMGAKEENIFELKPGGVLEFGRNNVRRGQTIPVKNVLVDGLGIGDVGNVVLRDRQVLAKDGVVIAHIQIDKAGNSLITNPDLISRGFVFEKREKDFLNKTAERLGQEIKKRKIVNKNTAREVAIDYLERHFYKETGRRPMVLPVIVEV